jgi:hypothetical protein
LRTKGNEKKKRPTSSFWIRENVNKKVGEGMANPITLDQHHPIESLAKEFITTYIKGKRGYLHSHFIQRIDLRMGMATNHIR